MPDYVITTIDNLGDVLEIPLNALQVGDQSDFVTSFSRVLAETAPRIGPALSPLHFRYFCDKLAVSFCSRFYEYIFRRASPLYPLSTQHGDVCLRAAQPLLSLNAFPAASSNATKLSMQRESV